MGTYFLQKAGKFYKLSLWVIGAAVPFSLLSRLLNLNTAIVELLVIGPMVIGFMIALLGLYYILKSYQLKEPAEKMKLVYLIGLVLLNTLGLALVFIALIKGTDSF